MIQYRTFMGSKAYNITAEQEACNFLNKMENTIEIIDICIRLANAIEMEYTDTVVTVFYRPAKRTIL